MTSWYVQSSVRNCPLTDTQIYGVWGDENGDDGEFPMVGEASISLATACYGTDMNGNNGHAENDVLFIAFPGSDAVPGADGATWDASGYETFEESISSLGDKLIERLGGSSSGDGNSGGNGSSSDDCSWSGHCEGASDDESLAVTLLLIDRQVLLALAMMTALMI